MADIRKRDVLAQACVAGLARQELEHARRYDGIEGRHVFRLDEIADAIAEYLDQGGNFYYRTKPTEAARMPPRLRFSESVTRRCVLS